MYRSITDVRKVHSTYNNWLKNPNIRQILCTQVWSDQWFDDRLLLYIVAPHLPRLRWPTNLPLFPTSIIWKNMFTGDISRNWSLIHGEKGNKLLLTENKDILCLFHRICSCWRDYMHNVVIKSHQQCRLAKWNWSRLVTSDIYAEIYIYIYKSGIVSKFCSIYASEQAWIMSPSYCTICTMGHSSCIIHEPKCLCHSLF